MDHWILSYKSPAEAWNEALPLGNGTLGVMSYGRLENETLELNLDTLWSGDGSSKLNKNGHADLGHIWEHSGPVGYFGQDEDPCSYSMWPMSSGWLCRHLWEHYCYTEDLDFLKDRAYPVIEGAVKFYLGFLFPYGGYYVTGPSTSPENRFCGEDGKSHSVGMASTMDISILKELFGYYLKICDILGIEGETADVKRVLSKLPPFKTGSFEQIREWFLDYPETEIHHRHVSHLYGLYPGNLITEKTSELLEACRVALERRGDEGTGWCMAWKVCLSGPDSGTGNMHWGF